LIASIKSWPARLALPVEPGAFRLVLALVVFVHHLSSFSMGAYAVYVFFVLSGFWLHSMWVERYSRTRQPYLTYLVSRVWRLSPTMLLVSAITIPLLIAIGIPASEVFRANPLHLAFSSTFLLGYSFLAYPPVGTAWSLDVEMQFYVVVPLLAVLLLRGYRWSVLAIAVGMSLLASWLLDADTTVLPKYLLFFVAGMASAHAGWSPSRRLAFATGLAIPVVLIIVCLSPWADLVWGGAHPTAFHSAWGLPFNVVLALLTIPFAIYTVRQKSDATDRMFADLSYIVYLGHWIAMQWFFTFAGHPFTARLLVAAACFTAVSLASLAIWRFYDKPINRARARWVAAREKRVPPAERETEMLSLRTEPAGP